MSSIVGQTITNNRVEQSTFIFKGDHMIIANNYILNSEIHISGNNIQFINCNIRDIDMEDRPTWIEWSNKDIILNMNIKSMFSMPIRYIRYLMTESNVIQPLEILRNTHLDITMNEALNDPNLWNDFE